jgi:hypothetical protein
MVADYNGWADLPEAEREALDILELSLPVPSERRSHAPVKVLAGAPPVPQHTCGPRGSVASTVIERASVRTAA